MPVCFYSFGRSSYRVLNLMKIVNKVSRKKKVERLKFFKKIREMASTPSPGGCETLPSSPSSTGAQNAKSRRYDRQLRL